MNTPHTNTNTNTGGGMVRSVDCVLFSPQPATALLGDPRDRVAGVVAGVREIFDQLRPLLAPGGVVWLDVAEPTRPGADVTGLAWRTALAAQADGWLLRNAITYTTTPHHPTPTPGPGQGFVPQARARTLFLLTRQHRYYFALPTRDTTTATDTAVRWPTSCCAAGVGRPPRAAHPPQRRAASPTRGNRFTAGRTGGRGPGMNPGDVWRLAPDPPGADWAESCSCVPAYRGGLRGGAGSVTVAARAIALGCPPGGVVHDPLAVCGHGPIARAARQLSRAFHPATPQDHPTPAGDPEGGHRPRYGGPGVDSHRPGPGAAARLELTDGVHR